MNETEEWRSFELNDDIKVAYGLTERNMRIEDLEYDTNDADYWRKSGFNTLDERESKWDRNNSKIFGTIQGLMSEKEKLNLDTEKIKLNKNILPRDKLRMLKSARNLSWTINTLLERSKDRLSEYYDSQLREKSISPGKNSVFNGFQSNGSKLDPAQDKQFDFSTIWINNL